MIDFNVLSQELLHRAEDIAKAVKAERIVVPMDALPEEVELPSAVIIVVRTEEAAEKARKLVEAQHGSVLRVPNVELDRTGQVNLAMVLAMSEDLLKEDQVAVFLVGKQGGRADTLHVSRVGDELSLFKQLRKTSRGKLTSRAVFQRVVNVALALASEGREGRAVGAAFVVGDHKKVMDYTEQLIINPFRGYPEDARNILDDRLLETVKEFSTIDGAFVIRADGVIDSAGTLIRASIADEDLPKGLGARHAAAAGITRVTDAIAITVSESDGDVRVWRKGKMVTEFERARR